MLEFEEDIEDKVIDILKRCCDCYFNTSSFYTPSNEDVKNLRELNIGSLSTIGRHLIDNINQRGLAIKNISKWNLRRHNRCDNRIVVLSWLLNKQFLL